MHYVTHISQWMQKHKFSIPFSGALFVESVPRTPKHEKLCVNVSRPGCNRMYYVTHRFHQMQKHKFRVTCPSALLSKQHRAHPRIENSVSTLHEPDAPECTT
jgi:hypothetical protein